jgi:hypothetical protein
MPEEFSEFSNQSIRALVQDIVAIGNVLKKELPFDYLTPELAYRRWNRHLHRWDFREMGEKHHPLMIYTHYLDAPPEPKEIYPPDCCAVGTLQISSSDPLTRRVRSLWNSRPVDGASQRSASS